MLKNDDSENHVLDIQGMSGSHQGHARRFLEVSKCIWKVSEIFQNLVKIMIFMMVHVHCAHVLMCSCAHVLM